MNSARPLRPLPHRRVLLASLAGVACALAWPQAQAQDWPGTRPVTLVVGTPPGGSVDVYARALAAQLASLTGGNFVVENKPGANGNISADAVLKAPADGHTVWVTTQAMLTINPSAYASLPWKQADFVPIAKGIESPLVLVTNPSVPAHTLPELRTWIAGHKDRAAYASFSPGTPSHFLGWQLNERMKLDMVHVPFKGSAPQLAAILGNQVPLGFTQLQAAIPQVQAHKLNALAVTSAERSKYLPQVPTLAELGYKDLTISIWFGLAARAGTPKPVLDALTAATVKAQADAGYRQKLEALGFDVPQESGAAFAATIANDTARWARVVKATGFQANQ